MFLDVLLVEILIAHIQSHFAGNLSLKMTTVFLLCGDSQYHVHPSVKYVSDMKYVLMS